VSTTHQDIQSFAQFAEQQLSKGGSELSIDELFDMWRAANPSAEELVKSVVAVKAALADMEAGDTGIPADEHLARLRSKFNIPENG
jgi:hypothetical protein